MSSLMGDRIRALREARGMTQDELGEKLGVQKSAIRKYEKGSVENIKRSSIKIMADLFQVSPLYLMGLDESANAPELPPPRPAFNARERTIIKKYRALDRHGQRAVDTILDIEYARCITEADSDEIRARAAHTDTTGNDIDELENDIGRV